MTKLEFQNVNTNKLHDELVTAGVIPVLVESTPQKEDDASKVSTYTWVTVSDADADAAKALAAAHDPTEIPEVKAPTQEDRLAALEAENIKLKADIAALETKVTTIETKTADTKTA